MKRFRLSTLLLLIVIAALGFALAVQYQGAARREAQLRAELGQCQYNINIAMKYVHDMNNLKWQRQPPKEGGN
jgi:hypothetical protein